MTDIIIAAAARTAIGNFLGTMADVSAATLGKTVIGAALARTNVKPDEVDEVILGQVLTALCGQNPARQAAIAAGIPKEKIAMTINQVCGSGLRSVALGLQAIHSGDARIVVAGGQESMSQSPHALLLRKGQKFGNTPFVDTMIHDGLWEIFNNYHMGITAENIAKEFKITREEQDAFAAGSQNKAEAAQKAGRFKDEIAPVAIVSKKEEKMFDADEFPRHGVTAEALGKLSPAFDKQGTVTAGNASGLNDGAAAVVLMSATEARTRKIEPLAVIRSWASAGVEPKIMGTGPVPASRKALDKAGWTVKDLDLIEANEAFAAQAISVNRQMGWDTEKVNVNGGAIALGHPIGASGARCLTTLLYEMKRRDAKKGLVTLCIGGGMGIALCVERA